MFYHNFDTKITLKHGIIIKNWPLDKFCCPSEISSRIELNTLYNTWHSGTTHYYRMSQQEWDDWIQRLSTSETDTTTMATSEMDTTTTISGANSALDQGSGNASQTDHTHDIQTPQETQTMPSTVAGLGAAPGPLTLNFVNMAVENEHGGIVPLTKKQRKPRKDKGMPRKKHGEKSTAMVTDEN